MTTPLEKALKRELTIAGVPYTLVVSPDKLHIAPKGKRTGVELRWADLVNGEAALAVALNASLGAVARFAGDTPAGRAKAASPAAASTSPPAESKLVAAGTATAKASVRPPPPHPARKPAAKDGRKETRRPKR